MSVVRKQIIVFFPIANTCSRTAYFLILNIEQYYSWVALLLAQGHITQVYQSVINWFFYNFNYTSIWAPSRCWDANIYFNIIFKVQNAPQHFLQYHNLLHKLFLIIIIIMSYVWSRSILQYSYILIYVSIFLYLL